MNKGTLDCIYAAAADDEALNDALHETIRACGARSAGLFRIEDGQLNWERSVGMPPRFMDDYIQRVGADDPRTNLLMRHPARTVVSDADPKVRQPMQRRGIDRFVDRYDLPWTTGVHLFRDHHQVWNLYFSRSRRQGPPDDAELVELRQRVPHFARSLQLRLANQALQQRLNIRTTSAGTCGRIVIDGQGRIRWMDADTDRIMADTSLFHTRGGQLVCRHPRGEAWLERAQTLVRGRRHRDRMPPPLILMLRRPTGRLTLNLLPAGNPDDLDTVLVDRSPKCYVITLDWLPQPEPVPRAEGVRLTPRQWEVLALLAVGYSTTAIARHLGCATSTARNHSQSLLARFGVSNRVRMLDRARKLSFIN